MKSAVHLLSEFRISDCSCICISMFSFPQRQMLLKIKWLHAIYKIVLAYAFRFMIPYRYSMYWALNSLGNYETDCRWKWNLYTVFVYSPFHETLPRSSYKMHLISVRFYGIGDIYRFLINQLIQIFVRKEHRCKQKRYIDICIKV